MRKILAAVLIGASALAGAGAVAAQTGPLRIEIDQGVIEPLPYAVPDFVPETPSAAEHAAQIARVVAADLSGTGLFREVPASAHISKVTGFDNPVKYADWKAVNAQALITGGLSVNGNRLTVRFRGHDVFAEKELGSGLQFAGTTDGWRRMAHKVADVIYSRITGESGYFDSRVVFVSESGPKNDRRKADNGNQRLGRNPCNRRDCVDPWAIDFRRDGRHTMHK